MAPLHNRMSSLFILSLILSFGKHQWLSTEISSLREPDECVLGARWTDWCCVRTTQRQLWTILILCVCSCHGAEPRCDPSPEERRSMLLIIVHHSAACSHGGIWRFIFSRVSTAALAKAVSVTEISHHVNVDIRICLSNFVSYKTLIKHRPFPSASAVLLLVIHCLWTKNTDMSPLLPVVQYYGKLNYLVSIHMLPFCAFDIIWSQSLCRSLLDLLLILVHVPSTNMEESGGVAYTAGDYEVMNKSVHVNFRKYEYCYDCVCSNTFKLSVCFISGKTTRCPFALSCWQWDQRRSVLWLPEEWSREHEGIQSAAERHSTLQGVVKLKCPSAVIHRSRNYSWAMLTVFEEGWDCHLLYPLYWGSGFAKISAQKRKTDKRLKIGGGSGREPALPRAFCNQRPEYYSHRSTITLYSAPPQGTRTSSNWPTSVLCVADGRRRCPDGRSWSLRWKPCSRLGNINNKT